MGRDTLRKTKRRCGLSLLCCREKRVEERGHACHGTPEPTLDFWRVCPQNGGSCGFWLWSAVGEAATDGQRCGGRSVGFQLWSRPWSWRDEGGVPELLILTSLRPLQQEGGCGGHRGKFWSIA